jgi:F0F1-type ATP synthase alpha subunit
MKASFRVYSPLEAVARRYFHASSRFDQNKAVFFNDQKGVVAKVYHDSTEYIGLSHARISSIIKSSKTASTAIVTELLTNGSVIASNVNKKSPSINEFAEVEMVNPELKVSVALCGRMLDPMMTPLDGKGDLIHSSQESNTVVPFFPQIEDDVTLRKRSHEVISTGIKAWDVAHPLIKGRAVAASGLIPTSLRLDMLPSLMESVSAMNEAAVYPERKTVVVYASCGHSEDYTRQLFCRISAETREHLVAIVSSSNDPPGLQYLSPFAGLAIAKGLMRLGHDVLVIYDDLVAHIQVAKQVFRHDSMTSMSFPFSYGSFVDACCELSGKDGSITAFAIVPSAIQGSQSSSLTELRSFQEYLASVVSLMDDRLIFSPRSIKAGTLFPLDFETFLIHPGHAAQGKAFQLYVERLRILLSQLRECAKNVVIAKAYSVGSEADTDFLMDLHTKARLMLLPTLTLLQECKNSQTLSVEAVNSLGLDGLSYASASRSFSPSGKTAGDDGASQQAAPALSSSSSSSSRADLLKKLDPAQAALLASVRASKAGKVEAAKPLSDPVRSSSPPASSPSSSGSTSPFSSLSFAASPPAPADPDNALKKHRGPPERAFLDLFALTHGYVQRVPLHKLVVFEEELFNHISSFPALPVELTGEEVVGEIDQDRCGFSSVHPPTALLSQILSLSTIPTSLVDATSRFDISTELRHANLRHATLLLQKQTAAKKEEEIDWKKKEEAAKKSKESSALRTSIFRHLFFASPPIGSEAVNASDTKDPAASPASNKDEDEVDDLASLDPYLRLDIGVDIATLPLPWAILHALVARFTKKFQV